jgi:hypothetical protein
MQNSHAMQRRPASAETQPQSAARSGHAGSAQLTAMGSALNASPRVQQLLAMRDALSQRGTATQLMASPATPSPVAAGRPNRTGLPDQLKAGVEAISGMQMDAVRVHYDSPRPAQLQALAFTQGTDIHVAPGQERHVPHEAWHVVQQAQGRVRPTLQLQGGVPVNDDPTLEREADVMGGRSSRHAIQAQADDAAEDEAGPMQAMAASDGLRAIQAQADDAAEDEAFPMQAMAASDGLRAIQAQADDAAEDEAGPMQAMAASDGLRRSVQFVVQLRPSWKEIAAGSLLAVPTLGIAPAIIAHRYRDRTRRETQAQVAATGHEAADVGHSLARHGPDVTDAELTTRLTTGVAPDGLLSPAPGLSSRFRNHRRWLTTRTAAVNELQAALTASQAVIGPTVTAFANGWANAVAMPGGPAKGAAFTNVNTVLKPAAQASINGIANPNTAHEAPLTYQAPVMGGANAANIPGRAIEMAQIKASYQVVIDHGRDVGVGFQGTGAPAPIVGHAGNTWATTAPAPNFTATRTTLEPPAGPVSVVNAPAAAGWRAVQHFPSNEPPGITG